MKHRGQQRIGQILVGDAVRGEYTEADGIKLRHYGVLLGRLLEGARRAHRWRKLALTDDLTSLPNRRRLIQFLDEKLTWAKREEATVTVLLFDIDDFKRYNDTLGHPAGDKLLNRVGRQLSHLVRDGDTVARIGGDEFVILLPEIEEPEEAIGVAGRTLKRISRRRTLLGQEIVVTTSIGISLYPPDGEQDDTGAPVAAAPDPIPQENAKPEGIGRAHV